MLLLYIVCPSPACLVSCCCSVCAENKRKVCEIRRERAPPLCAVCEPFPFAAVCKIFCTFGPFRVLLLVLMSPHCYRC